MAKSRKLLLLPGDGIGPEVVREVKKIIEWFNKNKSLDFSFDEELIGGASIDVNKIPQKVIWMTVGKNGVNFKNITERNKLYSIWYDLTNNIIEFWGHRNKIHNARKYVSKNIDKNLFLYYNYHKNNLSMIYSFFYVQIKLYLLFQNPFCY